jgi:YrbI family 3-deoxy-D-manno-octulosonate 8-phosphate phosphatase
MKKKLFIPKLIIFDFDGVFTDNKVYTLENGLEMVCCSKEDSLGINFIHKLKIPMLILSTEINKVVYKRARKLSIKLIQGCLNKEIFLKKYLKKNNLKKNEVIYVGNDINDIKAIDLVGYSICPADANKEFKKKCNLILNKSGGQGAIREVCDLIKNLIDLKEDKYYETI